MKFELAASLVFLTQLVSLGATAIELNKRDDDNKTRYITSDGVVYRYAVKTSTIAPASVILHTRYYTTTFISEITLENNEVSTMTEKITSASVSSQSVGSSDITDSSSNVSTTSENNSSSSSSENQDGRSSFSSFISSAFSYSDDASVPTDSSESAESSQTIEPSVKSLTSESIITEKTHSSSDSILHSADHSDSLPSSTTNTAFSSSITSSAAVSSSSFVFGNKSYSISKSDGTCYVYYEDDEYYSTVYLTESGQSVDAARTITSTRTAYKTVTTQI